MNWIILLLAGLFEVSLTFSAWVKRELRQDLFFICGVAASWLPQY